METNNILKRWIEGIHNITPTQQLHAKMIGHIGGVIGLILAMFVLWSNGQWYWIVFLGFMVFLQYLEFISARQQWKKACEIDEQIRGLKVMEEGK